MHQDLLWVSSTYCSSILTVFRSRIEIESTRVEVDCGAIMLPVLIATRHSFDLLNLGVECLRKGIGYSVFQVCENVVQMPLYRLANLTDGAKSAVGSARSTIS